MASFDAAISFVLGNEGGYQANPNDSGNYDEAGNLLGTRYGITAKVARAYGYDGPMDSLPLETAKSIYADEYWSPYMDGIASNAIASKILDFRVNFGTGGGTKLAQRAANQFAGVSIAEDGGLGPATVSAINSIEPNAYMDSLIQVATEQYQAIAASDPEKETFLSGWLNRVVKIPLDNPLASSGVLLLLLGGAILFGRK